MLRPRCSLRPATASIVFVALLSSTAVAGELAAPSVGPRLGLLLEPGARGLPRAVIEDGRPAPLARIEVSWERIERIEGAFDWTGVVPTIDSLVAAGYRPVVALVGSNPLYLADGTGPSPLVDGSMDAVRATPSSPGRRIREARRECSGCLGDGVGDSGSGTRTSSTCRCAPAGQLAPGPPRISSVGSPIATRALNQREPAGRFSF